MTLHTTPSTSPHTLDCTYHTASHTKDDTIRSKIRMDKKGHPVTPYGGSSNGFPVSCPWIDSIDRSNPTNGNGCVCDRRTDGPPFQHAFVTTIDLTEQLLMNWTIRIMENRRGIPVQPNTTPTTRMHAWTHHLPHEVHGINTYPRRCKQGSWQPDDWYAPQYGER